jgi:hypothetical protein
MLTNSTGGGGMNKENRRDRFVEMTLLNVGDKAGLLEKFGEALSSVEPADGDESAKLMNQMVTLFQAFAWQVEKTEWRH